MLLKLLTVNAAIDRYIQKVYGYLLFDHFKGTEANTDPSLQLDMEVLTKLKKSTASVHLRVGYSGEPATGNLLERGFPPTDYFAKAFKSIVGIRREKGLNLPGGGGNTTTTFLIFADNIGEAKVRLKHLADQGYQMVFIDENVVTSVRDKLPPSTSFFANSRTLMGCTDPLRRGVRQCPLELVACRFMLTCGFTFR